MIPNLEGEPWRAARVKLESGMMRLGKPRPPSGVGYPRDLEGEPW